MTTDTDDMVQRDYKAKPATSRHGTHALITVAYDVVSVPEEEPVVLVLKAFEPEKPGRWGLPGGSWGRYPEETPFDTVRRLVEARLGIVAPISPVVLGVDWTPQARFAPGMNYIFDGGVLPAASAEQIRPVPGGGYADVRILPPSRFSEIDIDHAAAARISLALAQRRSRAGVLMTMRGELISIPASRA
ncbi:hypothetical protein ACFV4P_24015 [Kitasatospora sp. NPDC059795]|uniref:hypothetical protein n=1 Tax=Kitasatospora sp. NPDC059795 TaxID=3346949 RepID=UPI0036589F66